MFNWEWTQMEQTASRLLEMLDSWYEHGYVYDGYTNKGEVLEVQLVLEVILIIFQLNKI